MKQSTFSFSEPEKSPGFLLWQATAAWQKHIKKELEPFEITHSQFVMLALSLWHYEQKLAINQVDLVNLSKLDKMTVSKALKKLVRLGLLEREEFENDTRVKTVKITRRGISITKKLVPIVEKIDALFFDILAKKEENALISILKKLASSELTLK